VFEVFVSGHVSIAFLPAALAPHARQGLSGIEKPINNDVPVCWRTRIPFALATPAGVDDRSEGLAQAIAMHKIRLL
jgi:hypothetical protein